MMRDIFSRQKRPVNEINSLLFGLSNKRIICKEFIEKEKESTLNQLVKHALLNLNFSIFKLLENESNKVLTITVVKCLTVYAVVFQSKERMAMHQSECLETIHKNEIMISGYLE